MKHVRSSNEDLLKLLPYAPQAAFNSYDKQYEPACLPDTRVDVLNEIRTWIDGQDGRCIFCLSGFAGTGKSTIARTIAREYNERKRLGASFFFSRGGGDTSHAGKFFTSIAVQLADTSLSLKRGPQSTGSGMKACLETGLLRR
jgi:DNA replication protein DnaC